LSKINLKKKLRSDQMSHSVVSDSLRPHESQHARPLCPSPTPGVHSDSCPSSQRCHPATSSSVNFISFVTLVFIESFFGGVSGFCCPCSGTVYRCWEWDMATTGTTILILQLSFYFWAKSNWRYQWTKTHIMPNLSLVFCLSLPKLFFYQPHIYYTL